MTSDSVLACRIVAEAFHIAVAWAPAFPYLHLHMFIKI